jgi:hypothetical protein
MHRQSLVLVALVVSVALAAACGGTDGNKPCGPNAATVVDQDLELRSGQDDWKQFEIETVDAAAKIADRDVWQGRPVFRRPRIRLSNVDAREMWVEASWCRADECSRDDELDWEGHWHEATDGGTAAVDLDGPNAAEQGLSDGGWSGRIRWRSNKRDRGEPDVDYKTQLYPNCGGVRGGIPLVEDGGGTRREIATP